MDSKTQKNELQFELAPEAIALIQSAQDFLNQFNQSSEEFNQLSSSTIASIANRLKIFRMNPTEDQQIALLNNLLDIFSEIETNYNDAILNFANYVGNASLELAGRFMGKDHGPIPGKLKVVFSPKMSATNPGAYSPSAGKPAKAVNDWLSIPDIAKYITVVEPQAATPEEISGAHNQFYVYGILNRVIANGFGNYNAEVAASLPYTSGAMITAALIALEDKTAVCAPTSGFHHATYSGGGGFCTFNGLMVAAVELLKEGLVKKVGILDCDEHYGNGTDNIIRKLDLGGKIMHFTMGDLFTNAAQAKYFLSVLPEIVEHMAQNCDIIFYQAGADPHINDPLGGWLTDEQLQERDRIVFTTVKKYNTPLVWNLAGGYQVGVNGDLEKVLRIHRNTIKEAINAYAS
jgi:acetoin utilization deacetylase AcuC-like enzyme